MSRSYQTLIFKLSTILFFLLFSFFRVQAADVGIPPLSTSQGTPVVVTITVSNVTNLFGSAFDLSYNSALLSFVSASKGTFLEQDGNTTYLLTSNNSSSGVLTVGYSRQAVSGIATGVSGNGTLMTITFNALSGGLATLSFKNNSLCSAVSGAGCSVIQTNWGGGTITINSDSTSDTIAPSIPSGVIATPVSSSQINLSWTASTDAVGVTGYRIYRNGTQIATSATNSYASTGLTASTPYTYNISAYDAAGNVSLQSGTVSATTLAATAPADTTAPSIPSGVIATPVSSSQINLSWTASTDAVGVTGYRIYRNGTQIATSATNSYASTGLTASTPYTYNISAYDAAGNVSLQSGTVSATTLAATAPADTTAPVISGITAGSVTLSSATITWTTNEGADTQVEYGTTASYGNTSSQDTSLLTLHTVVLSGLFSGTTYHYRVRSKDAAGNLSVSADQVFTTSVSTTRDTTKPTTPANVTADAVLDSMVNLVWLASSDDVGISGYRVYRNGVQIIAVGSKSYLDTGLTPGTQYTYNVSAYDAAGNESPQSATIRVTTLSGTISSTPTTQPTTPITAPVQSVPSTPTTTSVIPGCTSTIGYSVTTGQKCDSVTVATPTTPSVSPTINKNLSLGLRNDQEVIILQKILNAESVYPENIVSGYFGPLTQKAVIAFQNKYKITPTGSVDTTTRSKLNDLIAQKYTSIITPTVKTTTSSTFSFRRWIGLGSTGEDVRGLQTFLAKDFSLYPEGQITGYFGPKTKLAVQRFQCRYQIICNGDASSGYGSLGPQTRAKLNELK